MAMDLDSTGLDALDKLHKVLKLEERKGYLDDSVGNGVATFAGERISRLLSSMDPESGRVLREVDGLLADYGQMSPENRERCAREAARLLQGVISTARLNVRATASQSTPSPQTKRTNRKQPAPRRTASISSLGDSVTKLPGVGPARAKQLEQLGVRTVRDLLELYPRRYLDYSRLDPISSLVFGAVSTVRGRIESIDVRPTRTGKKLVDMVVADDTGSIHAIFFNPYIEQQVRPGMEVSLSGRIDQMRGRLCFKSPEWEALTPEAIHTGRIVPVYPLTKGLYQKTMRNLVRRALDAGLDLVEEHLPQTTLERVSDPPLIPLRDALNWIHYPEGDTIDQARRRWKAAKSRIAFDEFFGMQLGLLQKKQDVQSLPGTEIPVDRELLRVFLEALPFQLTEAQDRTLNEILADMASPQPMTRLLQGDVGSGKTAVAAAAAFLAIRAGFQAAIMAPTELLAEQHERSFNTLFQALPTEMRPRVGMITGSATAAARRELYRAIETGYFDLVVGTHALIQESVSFDRLGFVVVDEQHRFGVEQRSALRAKGVDPDVLVMTATPIPRSLALTLHGDLDVSTIDELPPGRKPIETRWVRRGERNRAYQFVREQVQSGNQAFIVFPLVEESETVDARAAVEEYRRLSEEVFPDLRVGLLHGRMRGAEKDAVMIQFRDRELDILVSTSVVEVGIDIPNATVMLIENADRFGLAQLHQFRGRVGRGSERSYCLLLADDVGQEGRTRLEAMVDSQDGFQLAQIDLEMRGPGDMFGTRQSGLPELNLASFADTRDLERARREAERVLEEDPDLMSPEHAALRARVDAIWSSVVTEVS